MGPFQGLNPGPPAPEAGIIPLDQMDTYHITHVTSYIILKSVNTMLFNFIDGGGTEVDWADANLMILQQLRLLSY